MIRLSIAISWYCLATSVLAARQVQRVPHNTYPAPASTAQSILPEPRQSLAEFIAAVTVHPEGHTWWYFTDPNCPSSPDTIDMWIEYWDQNGFSYDIYAGHGSYDCDDGFHPANFSSSYAYQDCNSYWSGISLCPYLGWGSGAHPEESRSRVSSGKLRR
jgi:hypothetical protein